MLAAPTHDAKLFFIFGRGRSGTSLLREILNAHPKVVVSPESMFILSTWPKYQWSQWTDDCIRRFVDDVFLESRMKNWNLRRDQLERALLRVPPDERDFASMIQHVHRLYARSVRQDAALCGDKNPTYSLFARQLSETFPRAPSIVIVRDPIDNVASFRRVPFDSQDSATLAWRWRIYNQRLCEYVERSGGNALLVRYEDLVADPVTTLPLICNHLGVDYDARMLRFHERIRRPLESWHLNLGQPLNTSRVGQGRNELSLADQRIVESITEPLAREFHYLPLTTNPSRALSYHSLLGRLCAHAWVFGEHAIFRLPARMRAFLLDSYRFKTGSLGPMEPDRTSRQESYQNQN